MADRLSRIAKLRRIGYEFMVVFEMKKLKLIALVYSAEDKKKMQKWLKSYSNQVQVVHWSEPLTVPLQSAVAHFAEQEGVDGVLIDDHTQYDSIVINRVIDILKITRAALFSAASCGNAIYSAVPARVQSLVPAKSAAPKSLTRAS